ncbi:MAG: hypothetical protein KAJ86_05925 [Alphaproteobacteria bacterium]|nr:hypothetical protein [Alphaproteobacteria bacterium]
MIDLLDKILRKRAEPQFPVNLVANIINASKNISQQKSCSYNGWIISFFDNLFLPQPAFVLAFLLLLGTFFGFELENAYMFEHDLSILYIEDSLELRDWL